MVTSPNSSTVAAFLRRHRVMLLVLAAHIVFWAGVDQFISPHPDYIDHWVQSRVFSLGYYEHPPMIAWLIRALTSVVGSSEPALEAIAIFVNVGILVALYALAMRTFGVRAAIVTLLAAETSIYFTAGTPMLQIEQPLMLCWLGALACLLEYQRTRRPAWLLAMGVCAGLGALSKYTMILFYISLFAYLLWVPTRRKELWNPWLYAAGLLSLSLTTPVLLWNAQHDWISFRFQLSKAGGATEAFLGKHLIEFTVGYLLLFSPVLSLGGLLPTVRRQRAMGRTDQPETLLSVMALVPIAFFSVAMIRGSFPDPKWANVGFLSFFLLLGPVVSRLWEAGLRRRVALWVAAAFALNIAVLVGVGLHTWHPKFVAPEGGDPTQQIVGWDDTARQVDALLAEHHVPQPRYVTSFLYPLSSQFALHLPYQPLTHNLKRPGRDLWSPPERMTPENTIFVCEGRECNWIYRLTREQLGWELKVLGTVETRLWGTTRQRVTVMVGEKRPGPPPAKQGVK